MYTGGFVNGTGGLSTGETSLELSFVQHERSYLLHLAIGGVMLDKVQVLLQYGADTNVAREVSCVLIWDVGCWMYMGLKGHVHIMSGRVTKHACLIFPMLKMATSFVVYSNSLHNTICTIHVCRDPRMG